MTALGRSKPDLGLGANNVGSYQRPFVDRRLWDFIKLLKKFAVRMLWNVDVRFVA